MGQQQPQTDWRKVHKRKNEHLLFSEDLGPLGTKVDVEVVDSGVFMLKGADNTTEAMPWIAFRGKTKKLGLNRGNCKAMESMAGTRIIEHWRGWITLVVVRTTYTDKQTKQRLTTDAIRVAPERPKGRRSAGDEPSQVVPSGGQPDEDELRLIAERERQEAERG